MNSNKKETSRVEAFSDGVFAIAITLLVLDLKVPRIEGITLGNTLLSQWPVYIAFLISFVTILIMWINHHNLFSHIRSTDGTFLFINGFLLFTVTIVPFPTALLAEYIRYPGAAIAAAVYAGMFMLNCVSFNILWHYACNNGLIKEELDKKIIVLIKRQAATGIPLYLTALVLAFINVYLSITTCFLLAAFFAFAGLKNQSR